MRYRCPSGCARRYRLGAVRVKRGSTTITLQPFSFAWSVLQHRHRCASAAFEPEHQALRVLLVVVRVGHRAVTQVWACGDGGRVADARLWSMCSYPETRHLHSSSAARCCAWTATGRPRRPDSLRIRASCRHLVDRVSRNALVLAVTSLWVFSRCDARHAVLAHRGTLRSAREVERESNTAPGGPTRRLHHRVDAHPPSSACTPCADLDFPACRRRLALPIMRTAAGWQRPASVAS